MIVFSNAILASELAAGRPLTHARILWRNWLHDLLPGAVTASSEVDGFPADAVLRPDTGEGWKASSLPATLTIDLGTMRTIDAAGLVATLGSAGASSEFETSPDGVSFSAFSLEVGPADDAPIMWIDDAIAARYVRLTVNGDGDAPIVPVLSVGEALVMPRAIYGGVTPPTLARETVLHGSESMGGQILGQGFRRHGVAGSMPFQRIPASFYRSDIDPFVRAARSLPAFIAWRPETYPLEVVYARIPRDIHPQNTGTRDFMAFELPYRGIGHE